MAYIASFNRRSAVMKKPRRTLVLGLDDELPFGAHKNRSVRWILENNPSYVSWLMVNTRDVKLSGEAKTAWEEAKKKPGYQEELTPYQFYTGHYKRVVRTPGGEDPTG